MNTNRLGFTDNLEVAALFLEYRGGTTEERLYRLAKAVEALIASQGGTLQLVARHRTKGIQ